MLKAILYCVLSLILAVCAAVQFVKQLEAVSASLADRDKGQKHLELGWKYMVAFSAIFWLVETALMTASKIIVLSTILALVISVLLVAANFHLALIGFSIFPALFCVWAGNLFSSLYHSSIGFKNVWGVVYVILQVICLALFFIGTAYGAAIISAREKRKRQKETEKLEEDVARSAPTNSDVESSGTSEEDEDDPFEDEFQNEVRNKIIEWGIIILIVTVAIIIAMCLEAKFDFFPPYAS